VNLLKFKNNYIEKLKDYVTNNGLTYFIDTMGCAMNENDSNKYAGILESMGFIKGKSEIESNLILFNTCTVRENAENTLFGRLGALKNKRKTENNTYLVVAGCMAQQEHIIKKIKESYPYTDIVFGTNGIQSFPEKLYNTIMKKEKKYEYIQSDGQVVEDVPIVFEDKYKATVTIIYGCNNFCTYCIVPYVRGRERSRLKEDILNDIKKLAKDGYKEITLLGQNVNSYGKDLNNGDTFAKLLEEIEKINGIEIIRFVSPHPKDFTNDLIETISKSIKISKQIHLPLQSGSDRILKLMNRKYTKDDYLKLIYKMKEKCDIVTFSTDIIVGFPGETEEDFLETFNVVDEVKYDQIFMYIYSKRTGTKAAIMEDLTPYEEKVSRITRLKKLFEKITYEINEDMLGKEYYILVEGKSKTNEDYYTGRTNTNKIVIFKAEDKDIGEIRRVKIIKNNLWYITAEIV
jgi:tRNA-2-methylthio-N6-dimethylallyladenosine synthase